MFRATLLSLCFATAVLNGRAFADGPQTIDLNQELANAEKLLTTKSYLAAHELLSKLKESSPSDVRVWLGLGRAELALGMNDEAVSSLLQASNVDGESYEVVLMLGKALFEQGRAHVASGDYEGAGYAFTDARRFLDQAATKKPTAAEPLLFASRSERARGDAEAALPLVTKAAEVEPKNVEVLLELGSQQYFVAAAAQEVGNLDKAKSARAAAHAAYSAILAAEPKNGFALNGLGWIELQANDNGKAIDAFGKSVAGNPTVDDSYRQLFRLLSDTKENKTKLVVYLDSAVLAAKGYSANEERALAQGLAHFYRGKAKGLLRDAKGQAVDFKDAEAILPSLKAACALEVVDGLYNAGDYPTAVAQLKTLIATDLDPLAAAVNSSVDPGKAMVTLRGLADKMVRAEKLDDAREIFKLVSNAGGAATDWNNYAFFCRETGKYEESYAAYLRALELNPTDPGILNDTALILQYHLNRDLEYAIELYEKAIVEGQRVLDDTTSDAFAKESATIAVRDATNNSAKLRRALGK